MKEYYCKFCKKGFLYEDSQPFPKECPECDSVNCVLSWNVGDRKAPAAADNVRYSDALGVHPCQIAQAKKIHPTAEFDSEGRMRIGSRAEKIKRMHERSDFLRRRGSKINIVEFN